MIRGRLMPALADLCRGVCGSSSVATQDSELLDRFLNHKDETAFELLVWRHGPLVLGVCRRLLDRPTDVEDAFQATFLMLVRRGHQIGKRGSVGSWLYKVAHRIALRARSRAAKRNSVERPW